MRNYAGERFTGKWVDGELQGDGKWTNKKGDKYEGYFVDHMFHGRGDLLLRDCGHYNGYFLHGQMNGKGALECGQRVKKAKKRIDPLRDPNRPATREADKGTSKGNNDDDEAEDDKDKNRPKTAQQKAWEKLGKKVEYSEPEKGIGFDVNDPRRNKDSYFRRQRKIKVEDKRTPYEKEVEAKLLRKSNFRRLFLGFFLRDNVRDGNAVVNTDTEVPKTFSMRQKAVMQPVKEVQEKLKTNKKKVQRKHNKFTDMEFYIRGDICDKKKRIYRTYLRNTKDALVAEDDGELSQEDLEVRRIDRKFRVDNIDMSKVFPSKALIPRLMANSNANPTEHLEDLLLQIRADPEDGDIKRVRRRMAKVAVSDMEEAQERHRFLQYDKIWEDAENAFKELQEEKTRRMEMQGDVYMPENPVGDEESKILSALHTGRTGTGTGTGTAAKSTARTGSPDKTARTADIAAAGGGGGGGGLASTDGPPRTGSPKKTRFAV
jgi:hypothetical protein